MKVLFVRPNIDAFGFKPPGLSLLMALVDKAGHDIALFDTSAYDFNHVDLNKAGEKAGYFIPVDMTPYGHTKRSAENLEPEYNLILRQERPDMVMISIIESEIEVAKKIIELTRLSSNATIVIGGKYPTITGQSLGADITCIGEGVLAIPKILSGKCDRVTVGDWFDDLDSLPYLNWNEYDETAFWRPFRGKAVRAGDFMITWGCPNNCHYCANEFYHKLYKGEKQIRQFSIKRAIDELKYLTGKYNIEFYKFHDENWLTKPVSWLEELSKQYAKHIGVPFATEIDPKTVTEEKVRLLAEMGCANASMGVETGDPTLRKLIGRQDTISQLKNAFQLFRKYNVETTSLNMLGLPFETRESYRATVELNKELEPTCPQMGFFYPYQGTLLREIAMRFGFYDPYNSEKHTWTKPALKMPWLSQDELIEMRANFAGEVLNGRM